MLRTASAAALRRHTTALSHRTQALPLRSRGALADSRRGALAHATAATSTLAHATAATSTQSTWPAFLAPIVNRVTDGAGLGELQRLKAAVNEAETAHEAAVAQRAEALRAHDSLTQGRSTT